MTLTIDEVWKGSGIPVGQTVTYPQRNESRPTEDEGARVLAFIPKFPVKSAPGLDFFTDGKLRLCPDFIITALRQELKELHGN